jgi:hypothetical protein
MELLYQMKRIVEDYSAVAELAPPSRALAQQLLH